MNLEIEKVESAGQMQSNEKKILLLNNGYPSRLRPNYVAYIRNIKECLEKADAKVELLVMSSEFDTFFQKISCYYNFYKKIIFYKNIDRFDAVFINHFPFYSIPLLLKLNQIKQLIIHWHGGELFPPKKIQAFIYRLLHKALLKRKPGTIHITPSEYFAGELSKKMNLQTEKINVSPSGGVKTENFIPNKKTAGEKISVGFASSLIKAKGADLFLELIRSSEELEKEFSKKFEFHYIFYGKEKEKYRAEFQNFKSVKKWELLQPGKMPDFYNSIDVLVFPTEGESLGLVALEAMCCGVPVVGTNRFALPEYIIPGLTGETFEFRNCNSLKSSLIKCLKNLKTYNPRNFVIEKYSENRVSEQYRELLKKL